MSGCLGLRMVFMIAVACSLTFGGAVAFAGSGTSLPTHAELTAALDTASVAGNGGIFSPARMWAAIVDRSGRVKEVTKTTGSDPWPGSRVIAMQKANTANAFSNDGLALSTANLYKPTQPGGRLFGLQESNPINTDVAYRGNANKFGTNNDPATKGKNRIGGVNVFGGGLPLYHQMTGEVLGAIGVSGDSSCADHVIAWRIRHALGFVKIPGGVNDASYGGALPPVGNDDNIIFDITNGFGHPGCGGENLVVDLPSMENF